MLRHIRIWVLVGTLVALMGVDTSAQSQPEGQLIIAFDTSIAATYFDPAETGGLQTPFVFLYALHDALVKPLPGNDMAPSLAESWTESADGLVYEFKLREGLIFHNGDPFTAEDVKYSFLRYKGTSAKLLHDRVKAVEVIDAHRLGFVLHAPIFDSVPLHGVGPRVEEPAVGLNPLLYFTAPYEDIRLKRP